MTLNGFGFEARKTAMYKGIGTFKGVVYNSLKLSGEAGEIADKVGKIFGKDHEPTHEQRQALLLELGDVLWHLTNLAKDLGYTLDEVGRANIEKLQSRQERNVITATDDTILEGDYR